MLISCLFYFLCILYFRNVKINLNGFILGTHIHTHVFTSFLLRDAKKVKTSNNMEENKNYATSKSELLKLF